MRGAISKKKTEDQASQPKISRIGHRPSKLECMLYDALIEKASRCEVRKSEYCNEYSIDIAELKEKFLFDDNAAILKSLQSLMRTFMKFIETDEDAILITSLLTFIEIKDKSVKYSLGLIGLAVMDNIRKNRRSQADL